METETEVIEEFDDFFEMNKDRPKIACYGGAGSGKSHSVAQRVCSLACSQPNLDILVVRNRLKSIKRTTWLLVLSILETWKVPHEVNISDMVITIGKTRLFFVGMDDREKIKSFNASLIWVEEASEISLEDMLILKFRLRKGGEHPPIPHQLFLTFNPVKMYHWTVKDVVQNQGEWAVMHSTYKNNPFLSQAYIKELIGTRTQNKSYYKIYALGEPATLKGVIYENWVVMGPSQAPIRIRDSIERPDSMGLDFGKTNPMALVANWATEGEDYGKQLLYRTGMTNRSLIEWMENEKIPKEPELFCDPSEPDRIQELHDAGWNAKPADSRSVRAGIDYCQGRKFFIFEGSTDMIKEIEGYCWKEDKDGKSLEEPLKFNDHLMDAMRYARWSPRSRAGQKSNVDLVAEMEGVLYPQKLDQW